MASPQFTLSLKTNLPHNWQCLVTLKKERLCAFIVSLNSIFRLINSIHNLLLKRVQFKDCF